MSDNQNLFKISTDNMSSAIEVFLKSLSVLDDNKSLDVIEITFNKKTNLWYVLCIENTEKQLILPIE